MARLSSGRRWLGAASMLAAVSLVAGCSGGGVGDDAPGAGQPTARHTPEPRVTPTTGPAPVPAAGPVLPGRPLRAPAFEAPRRPNLLMVTVDDATVGDLRHMPHVRRLLVEQGVRIDNGVAPSPICVPARASLLTGQYAHNHGAVTIEGDEGGGFAGFDDADTLPVWLREAGYDTLFVGKYLNGYGVEDGGRYVPPGWTSWRATVDYTTYNYLRQTVSVDGVPETASEYSTDRLTGMAVDLLEDRRRERRPWYLWLNYVAPHHGGPDEPDDPPVTSPRDPHPRQTPRVADRHRDLYAHLPLPRKPSLFEPDVSDKGRVPGVRIRWPAEKRAQFREEHQQRVESLQAVDEGVAAVLRTLRQRGQLEDTYVVFESDNGYFVGEHNLSGKLWFYAESLEVPMVVRGPGLPRGVRTQAPVTQADWAPTFAALAGVRPGRRVDGVNVLPWLRSDATTRVVPIEGYAIAEGGRQLYRGVWAGDWTYARFPDGEEELYYRDVDPYQLENLALDPRYSRQLQRLRELTRGAHDCVAASCPRAFYS